MAQLNLSECQVLFLLVLCSFVFYNCDGDTKSCFGMRIPDFDDKILDAFRIETLEVHTDTMCAQHCMRALECASFFYVHLTQGCYLHRNLLPPNKSNDPSTEVAMSSRYFEFCRRGYVVGQQCYSSSDCIISNSECKSGRCKCIQGNNFNNQSLTCEAGTVDIGIGTPCASGAECPILNSECRTEGRCGCTAGYSYKKTTTSCEASCTDYGDTFEIFPGKIIFSSSKVEQLVASVDECRPLCLAEPSCVGFHYNKEQKICYVKDVDPLDVPDKFWDSAVSDFYQRNCA